MKKVIAIFIVMSMLVLSLAACKKSEDNAGGNNGGKNQSGVTTPAEQSGDTTPAADTDSNSGSDTANSGQDGFIAAADLDLGDYFTGSTKLEDDGGDYTVKDNKLIFNNAYYGDFCAVRVPGEFQNVNAKMTVQFTDIAKDLSEDAGTWWDSEFLILVRSNYAGSSFVEGNDPQAGYCITSWGDMKQFALGRAGYDDAFGMYNWPLGDGQPHKVEFTVTNSEDNSKVYLKVVVDGVEIASAVDDGSKVKKERPSLYPQAGGITLRAKYLGATVTGFNAELAAAPASSSASTGEQLINVGDYLADASAWDVNGENVQISNAGVVFGTTEAGQVAAVRLNKESQNSTIKFSLQFTDIDNTLSMEEFTWWDSEFLCLLRSALADKGYTDGQRGYSITSWGDMSSFYLGRSGYDDAFGEFSWPMADGKAHDFEISLENNEDNTAVTITIKIDGTEVAKVVDDGSKVKEGRPALFPEAGGVTFRCLNLGATVAAAK